MAVAGRQIAIRMGHHEAGLGVVDGEAMGGCWVVRGIGYSGRKLSGRTYSRFEVSGFRPRIGVRGRLCAGMTGMGVAVRY